MFGFARDWLKSLLCRGVNVWLCKGLIKISTLSRSKCLALRIPKCYPRADLIILFSSAGGIISRLWMEPSALIPIPLWTFYIFPASLYYMNCFVTLRNHSPDNINTLCALRHPFLYLLLFRQLKRQLVLCIVVRSVENSNQQDGIRPLRALS